MNQQCAAIVVNARPSVPLQSESADCGLVAISALTAMLGMPLCPNALRERVGSTLRGTTVRTLRDVLRDAGFGSDVVQFDLDKEPSANQPCIALWQGRHYVVLGGWRWGRRDVFDPSVGWLRYDAETVRAGLSGLGIVVDSVPLVPAIALRKPFPLRSWLQRFSIFRRVLPLAVLVLAAQLSGLGLPWIMGKVVDQAAPAADLAPDLQLYLGLSLFAWALQIATGRVRQFVQRSMYVSLTVDAISQIFRLPLARLGRFAPEVLAGKIQIVDSIQRIALSSSTNLMVEGVLAAGALVIMLAMSPTIAALAVCCAIAKLVLDLAIHAPLAQAAEQGFQARIGHSFRLNSFLRASAPLRQYQAEEHAIGELSESTVRCADASFRQSNWELTQASGQGALAMLERAAFLAIGAALLGGGAMTAGEFIALGLYREILSRGLDAARSFYSQGRLVTAMAGRLEDVMDAERTALPRAGHQVECDGTVRIESMTFGYSAYDPPVFEGFDLSVSSGECVAITGASGCGKSTLARLVSGVLSPSKGRILVGGHDLAGSTGEAALAWVGTAMQEDHLVPGSLMDNIRFFRDVSEVEVRNAARLAEIDEFIQSLPMRYETPVSDEVSSLSGGQRQRLLLARALCGNAKILVLDESTSHLDIPTEKLIAANIRGLSITRLVFAHREETIRQADRVIALDDLLKRNNGKVHEGSTICGRDSRVIA